MGSVPLYSYGDVIFDWQPGRGAKYLQKFVPKDFKGVIQSDGYSAYPAFAKIRGTVITLAACWAHLRRKFHEAYQVQPEADSAWTLKKIGELYHIERQLRKARAGPEQRHLARQCDAKPILKGIFNQLHHLKVTRAYLPKSPMGRAIDYALGQRAALGTYLKDVLTRLPQMTNRQVWTMTPEKWPEQATMATKAVS